MSKDIRKIIDKVKKIKQFVNENYNTDVWYHGSKEKNVTFFDVRPAHFTNDIEFAKGFGKYINKYKLNINNPFNTRNEKDLEIYNNVFIPFAINKTNEHNRYYKLENDKEVPFITSDLLWFFLRQRQRAGEYLEYDGIIVEELHGNSIVPISSEKQVEKQN